MQITGGEYNSIKIKTPDFENIKPTLSKTRQGIFNTLSSMMDFEGRTFIDMFSGSGIMSFEALSRGFRVYAFEKDRKTALSVKENCKLFKSDVNLYFGDSLKNILKIQIQPDVIFIDPPYNSDLYEKSLEVIYNNKIFKKDTIIILEHPIDKIIDIKKYTKLKEKTYSDKQISYLNVQTN